MLIDGTPFFAGLFISMLSTGCLKWFAPRWKRFFTTVAIFGIFCVLFSSSRFPLFLIGGWAILTAAALVLFYRKGATRVSNAIWAISFVLTIMLLASLFIATRLPHINVPRLKPIYVIGDSISAGIGDKIRPWPEILAEITGRQVINLAQPGAMSQDALWQAEKITVKNALVIVEIGGNDLIAGGNAKDFRKNLNLLLSKLERDGHEVLIFELPLPPLKGSFARAQASAADKYHAALLPKKYFTEVIGTKGATLDGLHLSQAGHEKLALIISWTISD